MVSRIKYFFISAERFLRATTSPSPPFGTRIIFFVDDGSKSTAAQLARSTGHLLQIIRCSTTRLHFRSPRTDRADVTSALAFLAPSSLHLARRRFRSPRADRADAASASSLHRRVLSSSCATSLQAAKITHHRRVRHGISINVRACA